MKKIIYRIYLIIILIVILINVFSMFQFSFLGFRLYRIGSGSMQPYLNVNDYILIKKKENYNINDVITYKTNNNEYVTHRIINILSDTVITKGDANNTQDEAINKENIIGKVVVKFGILGFIMHLFSKPLSWILLFIIGFMLILFFSNKKDD